MIGDENSAITHWHFNLPSIFFPNKVKKTFLKLKFEIEFKHLKDFRQCMKTLFIRQLVLCYYYLFFLLLCGTSPFLFNYSMTVMYYSWLSRKVNANFLPL